jgi:hypothetical protein
VTFDERMKEEEEKGKKVQSIMLFSKKSFSLINFFVSHRIRCAPLASLQCLWIVRDAKCWQCRKDHQACSFPSEGGKKSTRGSTREGRKEL